MFLSTEQTPYFYRAIFSKIGLTPAQSAQLQLFLISLQHAPTEPSLPSYEESLADEEALRMAALNAYVHAGVAAGVITRTNPSLEREDDSNQSRARSPVISEPMGPINIAAPSNQADWELLFKAVTAYFKHLQHQSHFFLLQEEHFNELAQFGASLGTEKLADLLAYIDRKASKTRSHFAKKVFHQRLASITATEENTKEIAFLLKHTLTAQLSTEHPFSSQPTGLALSALKKELLNPSNFFLYLAHAIGRNDLADINILILWNNEYQYFSENHLHAAVHELCLRFNQPEVYRIVKSALGAISVEALLFYTLPSSKTHEAFTSENPLTIQYKLLLSLIEVTDSIGAIQQAVTMLEPASNADESILAHRDAFIAYLAKADQLSDYGVLYKIATLPDATLFKILRNHPKFQGSLNNKCFSIFISYLKEDRWEDATELLQYNSVRIEIIAYIRTHNINIVSIDLTHFDRNGFLKLLMAILGTEYRPLPVSPQNLLPEHLMNWVSQVLSDLNPIAESFSLEFLRLDRLKMRADFHQDSDGEHTLDFDKKAPIIDGIYGKTLDELGLETVEQQIRATILKRLKKSTEFDFASLQESKQAIPSKLQAAADFFKRENVIACYLAGDAEVLTQAREIFTLPNLLHSALRAYDSKSRAIGYANYFAPSEGTSNDDLIHSQQIRRYAAEIFLASQDPEVTKHLTDGVELTDIEQDLLDVVGQTRKTNNRNNDYADEGDRVACYVLTKNALGNALKKYPHPDFTESVTSRIPVERQVNRLGIQLFNEWCRTLNAEEQHQLYFALANFHPKNRAAIEANAPLKNFDGESITYSHEHLALRTKFLRALIKAHRLQLAETPFSTKDYLSAIPFYNLALTGFGDQNLQLTDTYRRSLNIEISHSTVTSNFAIKPSYAHTASYFTNKPPIPPNGEVLTEAMLQKHQASIKKQVLSKFKKDLLLHTLFNALQKQGVSLAKIDHCLTMFAMDIPASFEVDGEDVRDAFHAPGRFDFIPENALPGFIKKITRAFQRELKTTEIETDMVPLEDEAIDPAGIFHLSALFKGPEVSSREKKSGAGTDYKLSTTRRASLTTS